VSPIAVGLGWAGALAPAEYAPLAVQAEALGFDALVVYGDLLFQPPALPLLLMAQATERVGLVLGCLNPFTAHPVEIAGQLAFLDAASGGRATLGLVRGAWLDQLGIDQRRAITAVRETHEIVSRLLCGDDGGFAGRVFSLAAGLRINAPVLRERVPLTIGTWSPKLAALAGEIADEVEIGGTANPAMVGLVRERIAPGERAAGRRPGAVALSVNAVTVVDEDGDAARRLARREGALYVEVVAALDPTLQVDPELRARLRAALARGDADGAGALIPDDLLAAFVIAGTSGEVADQILALAQAGARRVYLGAPFGATMAGGIDLLGRRVLPAVAAA
jgi:5,10-methylenetetrahydromethanopterin reductase